MNENKLHYAWIILISCCALSIGAGIFQNCGGLFFVPVGEDLGISRGSISLYLTFQTLTMTVIMPFAGKIFAKGSFKTILAAGIITEAIGFASMGLWNSVIGWYVSGVVLGIGMAFIVFLAVPLLLNNWFKDKLGLAMGIALAFTGIGGAIFNYIGGQWIAAYGWRSTYFYLAASALIITLPFIIGLVKSKPSDMGLKPYGAEKFETGNSGTGSSAAPAKGVSAAKALKTPSFYFAAITAGCLAIFGTFSVQMVAFAGSVGFDIASAGTVMSMLMLGLVLGKVAYGWVNDKTGLVFSTTLFGLSGVVGLLLMLTSKGSSTMIFVGAFLFGITFAIMSMVPPLLVRGVFGEKEYPAIFSYVASVLTFSSAFASPIYGFIFDTTGSYTAALYFALAVIIIGIVSALLSVAFKKNLQWD